MPQNACNKHMETDWMRLKVRHYMPQNAGSKHMETDWLRLKVRHYPAQNLGSKYTEKDWLRLKVRHYPPQNALCFCVYAYMDGVLMKDFCTSSECIPGNSRSQKTISSA